MKKTDVFIVLLDIRSTHNVGSIFRTADSVGVNHIYLAGYTPAPIDRFGRKRNDVSKTALGAEESVSWSEHENVDKILEQLKKDGVQCIAIEQSPHSVLYTDVEVEKPVAFFFGNEVDGVKEDLLRKMDIIAEIPQRGAKESLNVSVSAGVALYGML